MDVNCCQEDDCRTSNTWKHKETYLPARTGSMMYVCAWWLLVEGISIQSSRERYIETERQGDRERAIAPNTVSVRLAI